MEYFFLFLLLVLPILLAAIRSKRRKNLPPGPGGLPLIGIFHKIGDTPLHEYFRQLSKEYGPLLYFKLGSRPVLVANSSRTAEEILKTQDITFCSRPAMLSLRKLSYGGFDIAFAPYGEYWREMRKICVLHLLSATRVRSYRPIREDEVSRLVQKLSEHASRSETINMTERITFLTSTIICRVAFGKRYEHGTGESKEFNHIIREFQTAISAFHFRDYFPWLGWLDNVLGKIDHLERVYKKWDLFYEQLLDEHQQPDRPKSMDGDVVDILLQLRKDGSFDLPFDHIKAVLMDVYFASTDTIATTIVWAMTALIKNPSMLKKVQAELRSALPMLQNKAMVEEEDIVTARLPYFNSVIKETLRVYSTIPLLVPRETMKDCTIDGYEIPAKTLVHVNAWAISKDPELWKDPFEFKPERFLEDEKKFSLDLKGKDFGFIPFGAGRRGCPGITMALATLEITMANILYLFDWGLPDGVKREAIDNDISPGLTLHKKNPLLLVAKKFV
ncbi:UNVERIFIED_CONTAM: cytochrome [Sesamum angustifolium]|uniref:Cytochrome n=1 Tax=Sesamum angustifolium TaxID=2727405 RepID=A0AAW2N480_9LAMI